MAGKRKQEIITFKVDAKLAEEMRVIHNRSEFIRNAILAALEKVCPLCGGTGILTPDQKQHWENFSENHTIEECGDCHAVHLVCDAGGERN
ncbi:MAG TPA: ribbon-helix-helix domain-containing protein [Acidobacteriota bacterium]|nr:ribbon-helix-helix domain-containing protein [Acidobacteriota bacterium]